MLRPYSLLLMPPGTLFLALRRAASAGLPAMRWSSVSGRHPALQQEQQQQQYVELQQRKTI
jgi:hypothetical protein